VERTERLDRGSRMSCTWVQVVVFITGQAFLLCFAFEKGSMRSREVALLLNNCGREGKENRHTGLHGHGVVVLSRLRLARCTVVDWSRKRKLPSKMIRGCWSGLRCLGGSLVMDGLGS